MTTAFKPDEVDLTQYPLTASTVIPYFKALLEDNHYHFFEGAFGANRFQWFLAPENSRAVELYRQYTAQSYMNIDNREDLHAEWEQLLEQVKIDAIDSVQELPAFYMYWQRLSDYDRSVQNVLIIPYFEALKEWYFIERKKFITSYKEKFVDREVQDIEVQKWKQGLIEQVKSFLVFKGEAPPAMSRLLTSTHAKELARFYEYLLTGREDICEVPYIMALVDDQNISRSILDTFYHLIPQASEKASENSNSDPYAHFAPPFQKSFYGSYPLMLHVEILQYKMENAHDSSGFFEDYTREKVFDALKEYAKGFQYGYDNFLKDKIDKNELLSIGENDRLRTIYEFAINRDNNKGFSERHGYDTDHIFDWYLDGTTAGYFYRAWYYILQNHRVFERFFEGNINKEAGEKDILPAPDKKEDKAGDWLKKLKNSKYVWPVVVAGTIVLAGIDFHEKVLSFSDKLFPTKHSAPPVIEAKMIIRAENDSSFQYDYEISNTGGVARNITVSVSDSGYSAHTKWLPESNLSMMLDPGSSMIAQGNPNTIRVSKDFMMRLCSLVVEYADSLGHEKNCAFFFIISKQNYKDRELKYSDRNCTDSLATEDRMKVEYYNRKGLTGGESK